jgi:putative alpha-1,2-mannosidase
MPTSPKPSTAGPQNWRNTFDLETGFVRARLADGSYRTPFDPTAINYGSDYTEGNAWQYSWFAPQDLGGLVGAMGGDAATVAKLDAMFDFDNSAWTTPTPRTSPA